VAILYLPHTDHVIARLRIVNSTPMWFDLERTNSSLERRVFLGVSHALSQRDRRLSVPPLLFFWDPTNLGAGVFQQDLAQSLSQGSGTPAPPNFRDLLHTYANTVRHTATKFGVVIRLDERKIFTGWITPSAVA